MKKISENSLKNAVSVRTLYIVKMFDSFFIIWNIEFIRFQRNHIQRTINHISYNKSNSDTSVSSRMVPEPTLGFKHLTSNFSTSPFSSAKKRFKILPTYSLLMRFVQYTTPYHFPKRESSVTGG
eukprot:TCONS_00032450-protein